MDSGIYLVSSPEGLDTLLFRNQGFKSISTMALETVFLNNKLSGPSGQYVAYSEDYVVKRAQDPFM